MDQITNLEAMYHYTPSLIGRQVEAEYLPQVITGYKDNPFIEALPPIFEEEYVASKIARFPDHKEEQRKLGKQTRLHLIQQISDYVEPLPSHLLVEQRLSRLMRHGYKARNPLTRESVKQFHIGFQNILQSGINQEGVNLAGIRSTASGFAILGVSGQGKTTAIESSLLLYPQVIHHSTYKGQPFIRKQLVWLKLNCPHDGSLKGLCFNFLQAVDSVLETNYFRKFVSKGSSVDMLLPVMAHIATLHGLGALVIDEIQNLSFMKSGGAERMLNYFTQLINTIGVPVILIGTFKAMKLLSGSFSQARRSTGQGDMIMDRLIEGEEWDYFIQRLWKYQWTSSNVKLSDALKCEVYELSQGIVDIAVKLYMLAQWEVIMYGEDKERITIGVLRDVANRHMQLVQPLLKILKRNDPSAKLLVDDLYPQWDVLDQFLRNAEEKVNVQGEMRSKLMRDGNIELDQGRYLELVKTAIDFGVSAKKAEELAKRVLLKNETESDLIQLRKEVIHEIELSTAVANIQNITPESKTGNTEKKQRSKKMTRKKATGIQDVDDLRNAVTSSVAKSDEIYENLVELGMIPSEKDLSNLII
ncbi:AAA domain-containing protein [Paenibacillus sophorae]|uniref:AAA domain-containing protein n=1 Tax=Paenibacillus sophorae TaxID=1333845 RepID=A0A1H8VWT6_9BACL|nr:ATP-binding protein [Paenibacillus sophorae]QWU15617.1 ATP-binding protein [Paenibacillus sophorae]SEP19851.1 AAA domain-containing protein [Paenibacillus sophorae]